MDMDEIRKRFHEALIFGLCERPSGNRIYFIPFPGGQMARSGLWKSNTPCESINTWLPNAWVHFCLPFYPTSGKKSRSCERFSCAVIVKIVVAQWGWPITHPLSGLFTKINFSSLDKIGGCPSVRDLPFGQEIMVVLPNSEHQKAPVISPAQN